MSAATSDPNAGAPITKTTDMGLGTPPPKGTDTTDAPAAPEVGKEAPAPAGAPTPTDPPKDRLAAARREVRIRARAHAERQEAQQEAYRQTQNAQQANGMLTQERAAREALERQLREISSDPMAALAHLEKAGMDARVLTQKAIEANTPEYKLRAELEAAVEARIAGLQKQYDDRLAEIQQREQTQAQARERQMAESRFISQAADASKFPAVAHLASLDNTWKTSLVSEATRILQDAFRKTGQHYTNEEVLLFLERKYSQVVSPKTNGTPKSEVSGKIESGTSNEAGSSRTLTNASTEAKGSLPSNFDDMSDADQKKALAAMLRQLSRK